MATHEDGSIRRGFVLEQTDGRYRATPLSTVGELQFQLLSAPRTIVLPGDLDEATTQMLTSYGVPHEFLRSHLEDKDYSCRGRRPQDATATYVWDMPQFACCCGKCTTQDSWLKSDSRGPVEMICASLWTSKQRGISVLLVQRAFTNCQKTEVPVDPPLEDELREKLPHAGPNISIKDYINQLAYERWVEYISELNIEIVSFDLIWFFMRCVEENLDTARYIASEGSALYLADEHAWEDLLRRLGRRMHYIKN